MTAHEVQQLWLEARALFEGANMRLRWTDPIGDLVAARPFAELAPLREELVGLLGGNGGSALLLANILPGGQWHFEDIRKTVRHEAGRDVVEVEPIDPNRKIQPFQRRYERRWV